MHHALNIQEILSNIFDFCPPPPPNTTPSHDLTRLARTCRAFKEPALNALWRVLADLSPLARCLPEVSNRSVGPQNMYSFTRRLTETEWDILQTYTRRVRSILDVYNGLDEDTFRILSDHRPTDSPLFPNLHTLCGLYGRKNMPLLHLPFPSLAFLDVRFQNSRVFPESFRLFPNHSPDISRLAMLVQPLGSAPHYVEPGYFCRWQNLRSLDCSQLALDEDALLHLSQMPALTRLNFALSATLPASGAPLLFRHLQHLTLHSEFLQPTCQLLSQISLPAITGLTAFIQEFPSRQELSSFFAGIELSSAGTTIEKLQLFQSFPCSERIPLSDAFLLGLEDLRICMEFRNLHVLSLDIEWNVDLTDSDIAALAAAWPRLESFMINEEWGWNTQGGITPSGLVRFLQTRRSFFELALVLDTRGYTEPPSSDVLASFQSTLPPEFSIDLLDSAIEAESVPAVTTLFSGFAACADFSFVSWNGTKMVMPPDMEEYVKRWEVVARQTTIDAPGYPSIHNDPNADDEP